MVRVLLVDRRELHRAAFGDVLGPDDLVFAGSHEEAVEQVSRDGSIGVVVVDVADAGPDLAVGVRALVAAREALKVLLVAGRADADRVLAALRAGAWDYLAKPLHDEELRIVAGRAVESFSHQREARGLAQALVRLDETLGAPAAVEPGDEGPDAAVARVAHTLASDRVSLLRWDEACEGLRVVAHHGPALPDEALGGPSPADGPATKAFREGPILVRDLRRDARFAGRAPSGRYASTSFLIVPFGASEAARSEPTGVVCVTDKQDRSGFGPGDQAALQILARAIARSLDSGSAAVRPPEVHSEATYPAEAPDAPLAELARRVCDAVSEELEPHALVQAILRPVEEVLVAAPVALYLRDPERPVLRLEGQRDGGCRCDRQELPLGRGITGAVFATGALASTASPEADPRFDPEVDTPLGGDRAPLLCVPIRFRGRPIGVFRGFALAPDAPISMRAGELLGGVLSAAMRSVLLYRSLLERIEERAHTRRAAWQARSVRSP